MKNNHKNVSKIITIVYKILKNNLSYQKLSWSILLFNKAR